MPAPKTEDCPKPAPKNLAPRPGDTFRLEPGQVVFTDGSAVWPKDRYFRRAAYALWIAEGHPANGAYALEGLRQTPFRAELRALIYSAEACTGGFHVVSDCKGVVRVAQHLLAGGTLNGNVSHWDLWKRFVEAIAERPGDLR